MKKVMMIVAAAATVGVAVPAMAQTQTYKRSATDGPSRSTFRGGASTYNYGESKRAERFGDCVVAKDPLNSAAYAKAPEGSTALTAAGRALEPAFDTCRAYLQNWAYYDANAVTSHRRAIYRAVQRREQPGS